MAKLTPLVRYTKFGKTRLVPRVISVNGYRVDGEDYEASLWAERDEDYYALSASNLQYGGKRVLVVSRADWLRAPEVSDE